MNKLEFYKNNIDTIDKHSISNVTVNNSVIYNGNLNLINKNKPDVKDLKKPPLAAAVVGVNNTKAPLPEKPKYSDSWIDFDAQELYLNSKPNCYLILGKPGAGAFLLGESIAKKLNCIHLCPVIVINDEIEQGTPTGKCIDYNLKHSKVLEFDIILTLLKKKLESPAVKHRGYVISGLPLVTSIKNPVYRSKNLISEESLEVMDLLLYDVIWNLKRKKPKTPKVPKDSPQSSVTSQLDDPKEEEEEAEEEQEPEEVDEEEEVPVVLPKFILDPCSDIINIRKPYSDTSQSILMRQLEALFNLSMKPDIIIYMTCPDIDLVTKKYNRFFNYANSINNFSTYPVKKEIHIRWPQKYSLKDYENPYEFPVYNPKYGCRQPLNFNKNSIEQMCNYKQFVLEVIEKKIKDFNPKNIIKVDARTSVHQMMYLINEVLLSLPTKPVIIPQPLYLEEPSEDMEEFWKSIEELNVIRDGNVSFNRYPSRWLERCPVELKKRKSVKGNPRFAVAFFKHVYLFASLDAMISFCRNPRPYIKLQYLEPTCRIITLGIKSSGKSMISKCLSWIFDARIICYNEFLNKEKEKKYDFYSKTILSEIIATIEDARFMTWQRKEAERLANLATWYANFLPILKEYIPLLVENLEYNEKHKMREMRRAEKEMEKGEIHQEEDQMSEEEKEEEEIEEEELSEEFYERFNFFKSMLSFLPFLDILPLCQNATTDKKVFLQYGPTHLITMTDRPGIPILGDKDVTKAISDYIIANDLQKEIEPTVEELMTEMIKVLTDIDMEIQQSSNFDISYGKYIIDGFPPDPEYWDFLIESKLLPDNTIVLVENREIEPELVQYYSDIEKCQKRYEERFIHAKDPLIDIAIIAKGKPDTKHVDVENITQNLLDSAVDQSASPEYPSTHKDSSNLVTAFTEAIEKFRESWEALKPKLEENAKSYIEVELENKSDIGVIEEVLLKLRQSYCITGFKNEDEEEMDDQNDDDDDTPKDLVTYNKPVHLGETNIYCPIAYNDYGVLWEGKSEFAFKYDNKSHYFVKEECLERFQKDVTSYQFYNKPNKNLPPLRICVIGPIGSGKTTISKLIAKEIGLIHIDFSEYVNEYLLPKHFKKVGRQYENTFTDTPIGESEGEIQVDEENENQLFDILGNEKELRRIIHNYFETGTPIFSVFMQKIIKKIWFEEPFLSTGFVLDGYPRLSSDVEDMVACFCIPDVIVELECSSEVSLQRMSPKMLKTWKSQLNSAKAANNLKLQAERIDWLNFIAKDIIPKHAYNELVQKVFDSTDIPVNALSNQIVGPAAEPASDAEPSPDAEPAPDAVRTASTIREEEFLNAYNDAIVMYPEPVDTSEWEKSDDARERIDSRLEARRVPVPDERFDYLCEFHKPASKVPAFLNVVDIAGLVKGAAEGQGLGNAFLSHIKACDAIFNLCRAFEDEDVTHVDGEVNPVRDLETIGEELRLKDEEQLMQNLEKLDRAVNRGGEKKLKPEYDSLVKIKAILVDEKKHIRFGDWSAADIEVLNKYLFLTSKPALYLVNLSEKDYIRKKNKWLPKLKEWIDKNDPGAPLIPFSGALETKLMEMDDVEKKAFLKEQGITSALDKIIVQGYKALQLEYFFTAGPDEVKAWTVQKGTKAPQAAGRIHTDFEKGFIMAEVMHFKDFREEGTEAACKAAGKYRQQGRNYVVEDGDIIFFKFNAGAGLKDAKKK